MVRLSYSTIKATIDCNKFYLNKTMGLPALEFDYFKAGKQAHEIIQKHVSGVKEDPRLIKAEVTLPDYYFPIVEKMDQDPDTHFEFKFNDKYSVHGYLDGIDYDNKRFLEIKTGTNLWTFNQFKNLLQRKIYSLAFPEFEKVVAITGTRDLGKFKKFEFAISDRDKEEASAFIQEGIDIIEAGKFDGGKCVNCPRCVYREVCQWRGR